MRKILAKWVLGLAAMLGLTNPAIGGIYTIPGFQPGINVDGINASYTYVPFDSSSDGFKDDWYNKLAGLNPKVIRLMDWDQTVNSPLVNWLDRATSDTSVVGVTYETNFRLVNSLKTTLGHEVVPWINIPAMASDDYAFQLGKLTGQLYKGQKIKVEYSNELWNGGDQMQGTWNLQQARANPFFNGPSDTEKMSQRAIYVGYQKVQQFKAGLATAGAGNKTVEWEWGGFAPNPYWTQWGMEFLKAHGVDPSKQNMRLAIAPYAPGSESDIAFSTNDSYATAENKIRNFVSTYIIPWALSNKNTAAFYGMNGIDGYEARAGSNYTLQHPELLNYMLSLQDDPGMRALQHDYWTQLVNTFGPDSTINVFGLYGIPHSQFGQWPLLDINELNNPGPNYLGVQDVVDFGATAPEPTTIGVLAISVIGFLVSRRKR